MVADSSSAFYRFRADDMVLEVFALRDIEEGEEIMTACRAFHPAFITQKLTSCPDMMTAIPTHLRKRKLKSHWGFDCQCEICGASVERIHLSDMRITFIMEAKSQIDNGQLDPMTSLELVTEILQLYDEEGLITPKAEFYMIAAKTAQELGDIEGALRFAQGSVYAWRIMAGEGSTEFLAAEQLYQVLLEQSKALSQEEIG